MGTARRNRAAEARRRTASPPSPPVPARLLPVVTLRVISRGECERVLARNVVGRIAFAHQGHARIAPATYVYANGWLYARADRALRRAIHHNRWVAVEVAEIQSVTDWQSVVVRGACYATSPNRAAAGDAGMAEGRALLRDTVPEMSREGQTVPFATAIFRVHVDELTGYRATSSAAPREPVATERSSRPRRTRPASPRRNQ